MKGERHMNIGIIGAGDIGQAFAGQAVKAGYDVIVSNSRGPESLTGVIQQLGPRAKAGVRQEAARGVRSFRKRRALRQGLYHDLA
jgi:predicted dinucleotide-binding enzyme